jgi:hypothetical protein
MKWRLCTACLIYFIATAVEATAKPFMRAQGREIVGAEGESFRIKGLNLGNWLVPEGYMFRFKLGSPREINDFFSELIGPDEAAQFWRSFVEDYVTEADIRYLKSVGVNTVRVPFNYRLFTNEIYLGGSGESRGFEILDRLVSWCRKYEIYVILDMHAAPGGQSGDNIDDSWGYPFLFENENNQKQTVQIWRKIAQHYRNEPWILGYDLLNEPVPNFFKIEDLNPKVEPLYRRITKAIRAVDRNHIIILGGTQGNYNFKIFGEPFDDNLVYSFHKYWARPVQSEIQEYLNFRRKYNVPIYLGESGENTDQWVTAFRRLLEAHQIGWTFWPYKRMEQSNPLVEDSQHSTLAEIVTPKDYDQIAHYVDAPRNDFGQRRAFRPKDTGKIRLALKTLLNNLKFENTKKNITYLKALGLWQEPKSSASRLAQRKSRSSSVPRAQRAQSF